MLQSKFPLFFKFRRRREILTKIQRELGTDPGFWRTQHAQGACDQALFDGDDLTRVNISGRFRWLTVDFNGAGPTGIGGKRTGLEQTNGPKPLVEPRAGHRRGRFIDVRKQATANL